MWRDERKIKKTRVVEVIFLQRMLLILELNTYQLTSLGRKLYKMWKIPLFIQVKEFLIMMELWGLCPTSLQRATNYYIILKDYCNFQKTMSA